MKLPQIQGNLDQSGFFIYVAADSEYFDRFGPALINSVTRNTSFGVHVHLYNPTQAQLDFCKQNARTSHTWEQFGSDQFDSVVKFWTQPNLPEPYQSRRTKMMGMKQFADSQDITRWLFKTYYACMRFVRLAELIQTPRPFLEIDIDGLVRAPFPIEFGDGKDFYLYQKDKGGHLAGSILYTTQAGSLKFIQELAAKIRTEIERDNVYWFLDQHSIDAIIPNYNRGLLPISYVDWHMKPDSAIWSAKGKRKELEVFKRELKKYQ